MLGYAFKTYVVRKWQFSRSWLKLVPIVLISSPSGPFIGPRDDCDHRLFYVRGLEFERVNRVKIDLEWIVHMCGGKRQWNHDCLPSSINYDFSAIERPRTRRPVGCGQCQLVRCTQFTGSGRLWMEAVVWSTTPVGVASFSWYTHTTQHPYVWWTLVSIELDRSRPRLSWS